MSSGEPSQSLARQERSVGRWRLIADALAFQVKLALDGVKDLILFPLSIGAAVVGLFAKSSPPGAYLARVMQWGKRYEDWIDLYGALDDGADATEQAKLDTYIRRVERAIAAQSARGGLTARAQAAIDNALDVLGGSPHEPGDARSDADSAPSEASDRT